MVGIIIGVACALAAVATVFVLGCMVVSGRESDRERERDQDELNKNAGSEDHEA